VQLCEERCDVCFFGLIKITLLLQHLDQLHRFDSDAVRPAIAIVQSGKIKCFDKELCSSDASE